MPSGLNFPSNFTDGSDIRLAWNGPNLLPRVTHTAIWRYRPTQQTGYYAVAWHSVSGGPGSWDYGEYAIGTHPYPASNGAVDGFGNAQNGTSEAGTVHFWEIAGAGEAKDWLTSAGGSSTLQVVKDRWYVQVRRTRQLGDGSFEYRFIPDLTENPNFEIVHFDSGGLGTSGSNPAFYIGASDWQSGNDAPGRNNECPSGIVRGIQLYSAFLDGPSFNTEALNDTINSPQTISGSAYVWYINQNPTSADVTDKSGAGHDPIWGSIYRPSIWTSASPDITVTVGNISSSYSIGSNQINTGTTYTTNAISGTFSLTVPTIFAGGPVIIEVASISKRVRL